MVLNYIGNLCIYTSQLICFARTSGNVNDFKCHDKFLTAKLRKLGSGYVSLNFTVDTLNQFLNENEF